MSAYIEIETFESFDLCDGATYESKNIYVYIYVLIKITEIIFGLLGINISVISLKNIILKA